MELLAASHHVRLSLSARSVASTLQPGAVGSSTPGMPPGAEQLQLHDPVWCSGGHLSIIGLTRRAATSCLLAEAHRAGVRAADDHRHALAGLGKIPAR